MSDHMAKGFCSLSLKLPRAGTTQHFWATCTTATLFLQEKSFPLFPVWTCCLSAPVCCMSFSHHDTAWLFLVSDLSVGRRELLWGALKAFHSPGWGSPVPHGPLTVQVLWSLSIHPWWAGVGLTSVCQWESCSRDPKPRTQYLILVLSKNYWIKGSHHFPPLCLY